MSALTLTWGVRIMVAILLTMAVFMVWWGAELFHEVTLRVFSDNPPNVPTSTAAAYATFFGIIALVVVGMWAAAKKLLIWRAGGGHDV
jgi:uncharacterized membrane protein